MGNCLTTVYENHTSLRKQASSLTPENIHNLAIRWKKLGVPFYLTPNEFKKAIIQKDDINLNYSKYYETGTEIEVLEFLTELLLLSSGPPAEKMRYLFDLFIFSEEQVMSEDEFYLCCEKLLKCLCNIGEIQLPFCDKDNLEEFRDSVCNQGVVDFETFRTAIENKESFKFAHIFQNSSDYINLLSTIIIDNPFPVLSYLQPGSLFLGKYEIIEEPILIEEISSIYKRKYKHAQLNVKAMRGDEHLSFELIYMSNLKGDRSFRQNFFREIMLKNKLSNEQVSEFGELPGGILYKSIREIERSQMTLNEYLERVIAEKEQLYKDATWKIPCLTEVEVLDLGLLLLNELDRLQNINVMHSNINPGSVYLLDGDINKPKFLDLELAVWEPIDLMGVDNIYFSQCPEDLYDNTYRDDDFMSPEHLELSDQYRHMRKVPRQPITNLCDLYSVSSIMFMALTGKPPTIFSEENLHRIDFGKNLDPFADFKIPSDFENIVMSNEMIRLMIKLLSKEPGYRPKTIEDIRKEIYALKESLSGIPVTLLESLKHVKANNKMLWEDNAILDLREFEMNGISLSYLYKFLPESSIPNLCIFGGKLPLRELRDNRIKYLELNNQNLFAEDLKALSLFIRMNSSLELIDLSNNQLTMRYGSSATRKNDLSEVGFQTFLTALENHTQIQQFNLSNVRLSSELVVALSKPLSRNLGLTELNLSSCQIGVRGCEAICRAAWGFKSLQYLNLSDNNIQSEGAFHIAKLLSTNLSILEIDICHNNIAKDGAIAVGKALTQNFLINKISISDNAIDTAEMDCILQSVNFNSQYKKIKKQNEKYGDYGYNLMAEHIKKWTHSNKFIQEKLKERLQHWEDEVDRKLSEILLDSDGKLDLKPVPMKYTYNPGEGTIHFS